jgi:hypothetical protein
VGKIHVEKLAKCREVSVFALQERAANTVFQWASSNAVAFDDTKSELLHFVTSNSFEEVKKKVVMSDGVGDGSPGQGRKHSKEG